VIPETGGVWRWHYQPVAELIRRYSTSTDEALAPIHNLDISVGAHPLIAEALLKDDWDRAHAQARELGPELREMGYQADGIMIRAGESWSRRFRPDEGKQEI
jgi:hypothetical protein